MKELGAVTEGDVRARRAAVRERAREIAGGSLDRGAPMIQYGVRRYGRRSTRWRRPSQGRRATDRTGWRGMRSRAQATPAVRIWLGAFPVQRLNACVNALTS